MPSHDGVCVEGGLQLLKSQFNASGYLLQEGKRIQLL